MFLFYMYCSVYMTIYAVKFNNHRFRCSFLAYRKICTFPKRLILSFSCLNNSVFISLRDVSVVSLFNIHICT